MKKIYVIATLIAGVMIFANCSTTKKTATAAAPAKLNFEKDVQVLVMNNCSPCHIPEKGGRKKPYVSFAAVKEDIDQIIQRIELHPGERGFMPQKRERLSDSTIAVFKQWKTDGLIEK